MSNHNIYKKYVDYEFEDFVADEFFVKWVKSPGVNTTHFWEKWLEVNPNKRKVVEQSADFVRSFHYKGKDSFFDDDYIEMFENIVKYETDIQEINSPEPPKAKWYSFFTFRRVAALFLLCFLSWAFYQTIDFQNTNHTDIEWITKKSEAGKKTLVGLSDGSKIFLNSNSELRYPSNFSDSVRTVYLKGEAYFEVEKESRPFIVSVDQADIEVLGTSFNVNQPADEQLVVALVSGKVKVNDIKGNQVMLYPSEMLVLKEQGDFYKAPFDSLEITGWKDNHLIFRNDDFSSVKRKIENWYGVEIHVYGNFKNSWSYTGDYHDENLQNVLKGIALTSSIKYKITDKKVDIYY